MEPIEKNNLEAQQQVWPYHRCYRPIRGEQLKAANFENLMNAFCGLFVVLTAQFKNQEYSTQSLPVVVGSGYNSYYEGDFGIGDMLQAVYPDWTDEDKYYYKHDYQNPQRIMFRKFNYSNNE